MKMKIAIDVYYRENDAKAAGVLFKQWADETPYDVISAITKQPKAYEPGFFYKRELPCIMDLLSLVNLEEIEVILIDGYVYLDRNKKPGLGYWLYESLDSKIPVGGIAKTVFHDHHEPNIVRELYRGKSTKPLYITAEGIALNDLFESVHSMHGNYRMPTLLKLADTVSKQS